MTDSDLPVTNPTPAENQALPLEELELTPQWVKSSGKVYAEHSGEAVPTASAILTASALPIATEVVARVHRGRRAQATDAGRVQKDRAPEDLVQTDAGVGRRNDTTTTDVLRCLLLPPCPSKSHFSRRTRASRR
jgi:hypothetical protein